MGLYLIFIHIVFCQFHLCHVSCCLFDGIMSCLYIISSMSAIIMWCLNIMLCLWCQLISFYHCNVFFYLAFAISICCVCSFNHLCSFHLSCALFSLVFVVFIFMGFSCHIHLHSLSYFTGLCCVMFVISNLLCFLCLCLFFH